MREIRSLKKNNAFLFSMVKSHFQVKPHDLESGESADHLGTFFRLSIGV
jgi:hypothetical protein